MWPGGGMGLNRTNSKPWVGVVLGFGENGGLVLERDKGERER